MKNIKLAWNLSAFREIRKSPGVHAEVESQTNALRDACGNGYSASVWRGRARSRGRVYAKSWRARRDNHRHNTLVKESASRGAKKL